MPISGSANAASRRGRIPRQSAPQTSTTPAGSPSIQRGSRSQRSRSLAVCAPNALPRQARACGPGDDAPRPRVLVDRQNPFRQSERLQQLEVANRRAIFAAEPEARRHCSQEPARRRLRRFPHRRLRGRRRCATGSGDPRPRHRDDARMALAPVRAQSRRARGGPKPASRLGYEFPPGQTTSVSRRSRRRARRATPLRARPARHAAGRR